MRHRLLWFWKYCLYVLDLQALRWIYRYRSVLHMLIRVIKFMKFPHEEAGKEALCIKRYIIIFLENMCLLLKKDGLWLLYKILKWSLFSSKNKKESPGIWLPIMVLFTQHPLQHFSMRNQGHSHYVKYWRERFWVGKNILQNIAGLSGFRVGE